MPSSFDAVALERWLAARPPTTLLGLADRLLIASVAERDEGAVFADRCKDDVVAAAFSVLAYQNVTTLCVLCACLEPFGVDVDPLRTGIALAQRAVGFPEDEPWRSTARYWLWRAGLARGFDLDQDLDRPPPAERFVAFAYDSHVALFDCAYGKAPKPTLRRFDDAVASVDADDADSVALLLLCAQGRTTPFDDARWWRRLAELQSDDGGLVTRVASDAARHHAACVAALAHDLRSGRRRR
jgi:hypothetical protein